MRTNEDKVCRKDLCWSVRAVYVLDKLPDVKGPGLEEVGCYTSKVERLHFLAYCIYNAREMEDGIT